MRPRNVIVTAQTTAAKTTQKASAQHFALLQTYQHYMECRTLADKLIAMRTSPSLFSELKAQKADIKKEFIKPPTRPK